MISTVIFASLAVYSWKILGFLIPDRLIGERGKLIAERMTVSLLAALVVLQGFSSQSALVLDARAVALVVAGALLAMRVPYIFVVLAGAVVAAGVRFLGF
tara:strand:+ start:525 stop:824 length:300 start_codon:yes stop_codon:yes gene_type:complete